MSKVSPTEVKAAWAHNASRWIKLVSSGEDIFRDFVNTPGFFKILPNIKDKAGLDIGCGEGHNTRILQSHGAAMTGIDITEKFIQHATTLEQGKKNKIEYYLQDATKLEFCDSFFDFATAFVSLIDIPDFNKALYEAYRVIKPNGFIQFSVTHPCFWSPNIAWFFRKNKKFLGISEYFSKEEYILEWKLKKDSHPFKSAIFKRTLSDWINSTCSAGFYIEEISEPRPSKSNLENNPQLIDCSHFPYFLIIRGRKMA